MEWKSLDSNQKIKRNFLTFSTIKSQEFEDMNPEFFKVKIIELVSKIVKDYYTEPSNSCINCDKTNLNFSLVEENNVSCEDCESDLIYNKSSRDVNGNIYYIEQILKKLLSLKNVKIELKEVVEQELLPLILKIRDQSDYERLSLMKIFSSIKRRRRVIGQNKHYQILASLI